jgi:hypothetical protein
MAATTLALSEWATVLFAPISAAAPQPRTLPPRTPPGARNARRSGIATVPKPSVTAQPTSLSRQ